MLRSDTPLWPITDSIAVRLGSLGYAVSPGDLLILLALPLGLVEALWYFGSGGEFAGGFAPSPAK
jgi:hypothetical protein